MSRLPQALEVERAVLGGLLLKPDDIALYEPDLDPGHFAHEKHQKLLSYLLARYAERKPMDMLLIVDDLFNSGQAEAVGGVSYVSGLPDECPITENLGHYIAQVQDNCIRRRVMTLGARLQEVAADTSMAAGDLLAKSEGFLHKLQAESGVAQSMDPGDAVHDLMDDLIERQRRHLSNESIGLSTGIDALDPALGPMEPGTLLILAARPRVGKTALSLQVADNVAGAGHGALYFSVEMAPRRLQMRRMSAHAGVPHDRLKRGTYTEADRVKMWAAAERMADMPMIVDGDSKTIEAIRASARVAKIRNPDLGMVVVDYIQLIQGGDSDEHKRVGNIAKALKHLARELEIIVVALSQLNRQCESRSDPRPNMADIRASGTIEEAADIILFPFRPQAHDEEASPKLAELHIAKHRDGAERRLTDVRWHGATQRFMSIAAYESIQQGGY